MIGKAKAVSRDELAAHINAGKAQEWVDGITNAKKVLLNGKHDLPVLWPGNTCDEIIELVRLREILTRAEPLHAVDRGNLAQVVHQAILERLKSPSGNKAQRLRDPWVALDYALRKWVFGSGKQAREDVARRWKMKPSNVARIYTYHDKAAARGLRQMQTAARKKGLTTKEQVADMLRLADQWPAMVAGRERMLEQLGNAYVPGVDLREALTRF